MGDIFQKLAKHLNGLPVPFPITENGLELEVLRKWFRREHAEIALKMKGVPERVSVIADRLGEPVEKLAPVLEAMSKQGLIFRMARPGTRESDKPVWLYNLLPVAEGMWEFQMNSTTEDTVAEVNAYIEYFMQNAWYKTKTSQHRVIPISQSIPAGTEILSYDHVERIIQSQTKIALAPCVCRKQANMLGKGCDHPLEVCMAFGTGAYYYIENGLGHEVSTEEALDVLRKGMAAGLVPQPGNGQRVWGICMCCSCACQLLRALKKTEKPAQLAHTNFYAACEDENCTSCGTCVDRCPMAAIELKDTAIVNRDRCIGCGVCVVACDVDAMLLHAKPEKEQYVPPRDIVDMQKRIAQERGLLQ
ncbi:MAG: 4Fe-4S binding protein [Thermodesulfobacteriota bacterium]